MGDRRFLPGCRRFSQTRTKPGSRTGNLRPHHRIGFSKVVSLESIHPQTRQLNLITRNIEEHVDGFAGELTLEK